MNTQPGESLLFSERTLAAIPKKKFHLDSWSSIDLFMDFATELFALTVRELITHGYLKIVEEHKTPIRLLGIRISNRIDYVIHRLPKSTKGITVGWLEEKILDQLKSPQTKQLKTIAFEVFSAILHDKDSYINPGKVFLVELLKHQKLGRFRIEEKNTLLSKQITIIPNNPLPGNGKEPAIYVNPSNQQFVQIIDSISSQLYRFQDLD